MEMIWMKDGMNLATIHALFIGDEQVNDDEDEEMTNAKVKYFRKGDAKISDVAKTDAEKIKEIKDNAKKAELPPTSFSLSVSLVAPVTTLLPPSSVSTIPLVPYQTTTPILTPQITTDAPTITILIPKSDALYVVQLRVTKLEKDVYELKKIDHSTKALTSLRSKRNHVVPYGELNGILVALVARLLLLDPLLYRTCDDLCQIILWIVDNGCSKHMTGDRSMLENLVEKFIGTVRFGNDHFAAITGSGDYVLGNITICHVYYVEGLGHNLFRDDLLTRSPESNLYTIVIFDMAASSPVCLMSKATSTKLWLWNRKLSHLNFGTINDLTKHDLVDVLLKLKYGKDHLCSAYSPSISLIIVEEHEAPPIVTISEEQTYPIYLSEANEINQKDSLGFDGNTLLTPYDAPDFSEAESSISLDPSNMHEFHQVQPSTHIWTKAYPFEQVIGDPSKPVMTQKNFKLILKQDDVRQDKLCPPNKRYALMDADKKIDLDNPLCPNESKIMENILQNHSLRFTIVASSSVPWIYLGQFGHTLQQDGSMYRLKFVLDRKEIIVTLNDFKRIFQLPQAIDNNHKHVVAAPKFSEMAPFFLNDLDFTLELRSPSNFKTTGLVQP
nr:hypothetical protein [Tanacetum cinerariifolium]